MAPETGRITECGWGGGGSAQDEAVTTAVTALRKTCPLLTPARRGRSGLPSCVRILLCLFSYFLTLLTHMQTYFIQVEFSVVFKRADLMSMFLAK